MLLAIDIGNTHTVLGVFNNDRLVTEWRIISSGKHSADDILPSIKSSCADAGINLSTLTEVGISSVVPNLTKIFEQISRKQLRVEPVTVSASLDLGIKIDYDDPETLGADRICNVIAGYKKYGGPLIVIDLGTATTYDVIAKNGDFLGGVIALGVGSTAAELHRRTAKLPHIKLQFPESVIGRDTFSAMQAGVMFGAVEALEGTVRRIRREIGPDARVIATGGLSEIIAKQTSIIEACEPSLVLEGIRLIVERQKKA